MPRELTSVIDDLLKVIPVDARAGLADIRSSVAFAPPEATGFWWREVADYLEAIPVTQGVKWPAEAKRIFAGEG